MLNVASEIEPADVGTLHVSVGLEEQINLTLRSFWETESIGTVTEKESKKSDEETMQFFEQSLLFKGGRYEVSLPWKNENNDLHSNYDVTKKHSDQLIKKFKTNVPVYDQYSEVIQDYEKQGIVECVKNDNQTDNRLYYLPHSCRH